MVKVPSSRVAVALLVPCSWMVTPWSGSPPQRHEPRWNVCSVQRLTLPAGWDALKLSRVHYEWLPNAAPLTRTVLLNDVVTIFIAGTRALVLSLVRGRSDRDGAHYEIVGGSLAERGKVCCEVRGCLEGSVVTALILYEPTLPFFL